HHTYLYALPLHDALPISPRRVFPSRRFFCELRVGRVGLRWRGTTAASATSSCNRASASSRLRSRLRCCCDLMTSTPSPVMRWSRSEEHTSELQSPYDLVC